MVDEDVLYKVDESRNIDPLLLLPLPHPPNESLRFDMVKGSLNQSDLLFDTKQRCCTDNRSNGRCFVATLKCVNEKWLF